MIGQTDAIEAASATTAPVALVDIATCEATPPPLPDGVAHRIKPTRAVRPAKSGLHFLVEAEMPEWDALVETSPQRSVFLKSWWLKAACGTARVLGYFEGGRLIAGMPVYFARRAGLRVCGMPNLTQTWGVVMQSLPGKDVTVLSREMDILDLLAAHFAQESVFIQSFHPENKNWLPFYWRGFTQRTHYTYVLDDLHSLDRVWEGLAKARRNNIRKARESGIVVTKCGPELVFQAASTTFAAQGKTCPYRLEYLNRLYEAARAEESGICMAAMDRGGQLHAAFFFVWDEERGYNVAGGHDPAFGASGGSVLLMWNLIEFAAARTKVFDFEGSMRKEIEASFRSFGTKRVAYNRIAKLPRWLRIGLCLAGSLSF